MVQAINGNGKTHRLTTLPPDIAAMGREYRALRVAWEGLEAASHICATPPIMRSWSACWQALRDTEARIAVAVAETVMEADA